MSQAYCFWGQSSIFTPYYGAAFVSEFLGTDGSTVAMLDNGTSAVGVYVVYSPEGAPLRTLVINTDYFDGTDTRPSTAVSLAGLSGGGSTRQAKRLTAPSAISRNDQGAAVTIGGSASFTSSCARNGTQTTEVIKVNGDAVSVEVRASEALIVFLSPGQ
jgi:hypothetical protein